MAFAQARYGFLLRSIPAVMAAELYLGLDTKVSWPWPACSMPATPVISVSGEALSRLAFRAVAMSDSFMAVSGIVAEGGREDVEGSYFVAGAELRSAWTDECVRPYASYCSNSVTCLVSGCP